jgi:hypothetical protein
VDPYTLAAERLVHARPTTEDEAIAVLEWIATREGKRLDELMQEQGVLIALRPPEPPRTAAGQLPRPGLRTRLGHASG